MRAPLLALLASPALADAPVPRFVPEESGIAATYAGEWTWFVGGGVAAFDCSGDGVPDLALAGGEGPLTLWRNLSEPGGALRFEAAPSPGIEGATGAYPLDVDGDGLTDLAVLRRGEAVMLRALGGCRFERANELWGFEGGDAWGSAFSATWEEGEGWPTVALGTYIDMEEEFFPWGSCTPNWLQRPGPGGFAPPVPLEPAHCALSMLFTDWDRSGVQALRVSNDREYYTGGSEQLWRVPAGAPPSPYTAEEGWRPLRVWGMGIAGGDVTGDGLPDYALTSMADNKLQALADPAGLPLRPTYDDIAFARGTIAQRPYTGGDVRPSTAWHAEFADVNLDGRLDLFIAKGNVDAMPDFAARDPNNLLLQQEDGTFREAGLEAGLASMGVARGATLADLNLDGWPDLVVANRRTPVEVWRNAGTGEAPGWLLLRPRDGGGDGGGDGGANRDAVGAFVEVRHEGGALAREVTVGGGHAGGQLGWIAFGLGGAARAEVRVVWPDGEAGPWSEVAAGSAYLLPRGAAPRPWAPGAPG